VENIETRSFLSQATGHLQRLTNSHMEAIACDLHPKFTTTNLAQEIAEAESLPLVKVQHHQAHAAALIAEHGLEDIVAITCDGFGYGSDGKAWGGEVLYCNEGSTEFKRLAHLESQLLLGGDLASHYPIRLAAAILSKTNIDVGDWLNKNSARLPHGDLEAKLIADQLRKCSGAIETTSCGRVLDAVSALLGLCDIRTYEGEPAMKLESSASTGKDILGLQPQIHGDVLDTTFMLKAVYDNLGKVSIPDLAYSAHSYISKGLASLAVKKANEENVETIGFSGGAACNKILAKLLRQAIESEGLRFVVHEAVPAGDGGVSFGQVFVAGFATF
jgi:hydrogenase maturation protein HypF